MSEINLSLTWLNRRNADGSELILDFTILPTKSFYFYFNHIFQKTVEIETALNSNYVSSSSTPVESIQLFANGCELSPQELCLPLEYFQDTPLYLHTSHCGALLLFAQPITSADGASDTEFATEQNVVPLSFDLGFQTIEDLKRALEALTGESQHYIFSDSETLVSPGNSNLDARLLRDHFQQCDAVIYATESGDERKRCLIILMFLRLCANSLEIENQSAKLASLDLTHLKVKVKPRFCDLTSDPEAIPQGKDKWSQAKKGLNLIGSCTNADCKLSQNGVRPVVPWNRPSFDLCADASSVTCPKCSQVLSSLSPAFYLTQWKYYGQKSAGAEATESTQSDSEGAVANEEGAGSAAEIELLTCDWQIADDKKSYSGFTVVDSPGVTIGLAEWTTLVILTRPLPKSDGKRLALQEKHNVGLKVKIPLVFSVAFNYEWFRDFRK